MSLGGKKQEFKLFHLPLLVTLFEIHCPSPLQKFVPIYNCKFPPSACKIFTFDPSLDLTNLLHFRSGIFKSKPLIAHVELSHWHHTNLSDIQMWASFKQNGSASVFWSHISFIIQITFAPLFHINVLFCYHIPQIPPWLHKAMINPVLIVAAAVNGLLILLIHIYADYIYLPYQSTGFVSIKKICLVRWNL